MVAKTSKTKNSHRPSKSQRTHVRRLKQDARKTGAAYIQPVKALAPK